MTPTEVLRNLRAVQEKHKNDRISTFALRISDMAKDAADAIESLRDDYNAEVEKNKRLTAERDAAIEYIPKTCNNCAYVDEFESLPFDLPHCDSCHMMSGFKWRGLTEQEDKP
jgi:predicted Zn-ribbon and HTH transcriptional regulator